MTTAEQTRILEACKAVRDKIDRILWPAIVAVSDVDELEAMRQAFHEINLSPVLATASVLVRSPLASRPASERALYL